MNRELIQAAFTAAISTLNPELQKQLQRRWKRELAKRVQQ